MRVDTEVVDALRERHSCIPELVFRRSVERAETPGELFDILEAIPAYPIVWDEESRCWKKTSLFQIERAALIRS